MKRRECFFPALRTCCNSFGNVELPLDVKDSIIFLLLLLSFLYTAYTVYAMLRVRTEASREFVWRPSLGVDNPEWHGKSKEMGQYLENFSPPMIWKFTSEQLQDPVKIISYVKRKGSDSSRDGQLTATCWAPAIA